MGFIGRACRLQLLASAESPPAACRATVEKLYSRTATCPKSDCAAWFFCLGAEFAKAILGPIDCKDRLAVTRRGTRVSRRPIPFSTNPEYRPMRPFRPIIAAGVLLFASAQANATFISYQTTIALSAPVGDFSITSAVFDWQTDLMSGVATSANLLNMTMRLFDGNTLLFTDPMIVNSVVQPIGGAARQLDDIVWEFDLDNLELSEDSDNDRGQKQVGSAVGTTYRFRYIGDAFTQRYSDGVFDGFNDSGADVSTRVVPAAPTLVLLIAGLPLLARRRKG